MTPGVISVKADTPLEQALTVMADKRVSCLAVQKNGRLDSLLTEEAVISLASHGEPGNRPVGELALAPALYIDGGETLVQAVSVLEGSGNRALLVKEDEEPSGIITTTDIFKATGEQDFMARQRVKYTMNKNLVMAGEMDSVAECLRKMADTGQDSVVITAQKKGVGIFTRRDAVALLARDGGDESLLNEPVYKVMSHPLVAVAPEAFLPDANNLMREKNIRRLVVVDSKGMPRGVVSQKELLKRLDTNYSELIEKALRETGRPAMVTESALLALPDTSFEAVMVCRRGKVVTLNDQMATLLEADRAELEGVPIESLLPEGQADVFRRETGKREEGEDLEEKFFVSFVSASDRTLYMEGMARQVKDAAGKTVTWFRYKDITAFKEKEEELKMLRDRAEESSQVKSAFLSNISHELRTPLTAIIGFAKLIAETPGQNETTQKQSQAVLRQGKNLLEIINRLLEISQAEMKKGEAAVIATVLVGDMIEASVNRVKKAAQAKEITLETNIGDGTPRLVRLDREKTSLALDQLLDNAVKFSREGGTVSVKVTEADGFLQIAVADTGIGVAEEKLENIFENFTQVDLGISREYEGVGLGLPLARLMALGMNGRLWAESKEGEGSTFFFTTPYEEVTRGG